MSGPILFCTDTCWDDCGDRLVAIDPTIEVVRLVADEPVTASDLDRVTLAFYSADAWPLRSSAYFGTLRKLGNLRWFQTFSAGTDRRVFSKIRDSGVIVTSGAGAAAPSIAHTVMLYMLALSRRFPAVMRDQTNRVWDPRESVDLPGLKLGIVGLGAIGTEVARLADAFGVEVVGLRRSVRGDEPCTTWTNDRFQDLLAWADAIAVTAPLTDDTRGMFDAAAFAAMKPGAWFINVGRGEIVDEEALVDSLASGHLGGAGLDVFAVEPLPPTSPLWSHPNVIITPHSSGSTESSRRRSTDVFVENFRRFTNGEPLLNIT
ncbi:MAG TPA: D-2-hydroxyacid dehydrogenase [Ilumatobacter sp.]|nr:D-2-hydroxyacid dehydrogenase [Ilumatobacter sp.]